MGVDNLSSSGRSFYENSLFKTVLALVYFALAMFYLGMVARAGGQSNAANILKDDSHQDYMKDAENAFAVGYGFSAFFHFCAFAVILGAAFHILPATGGSAKEAKCVQKPESLETN
eukprot:gene4252-4672_t